MKLPSWLRFLFTRNIPEGDYHELLKPGLKREFELFYRTDFSAEFWQEPFMTTYYLDIKNGKDTNTGLSFDQPFLTHERLLEALDKSIVCERMDITIRETLRYDWPTPKNFQNPMGEKK